MSWGDWILAVVFALLALGAYLLVIKRDSH
jgi:hypothetical protein